MKIRAAVLETIGAQAPYAQSRPLQIRQVELDPPGIGEVLECEPGVTATINAGDPDAAEQVRALTKGGVDYAFEMAGTIAAMELAWRITRRGGSTIAAGLPHPDKRFALPPMQLVGEDRTLLGSYIGSSVPARDIPRYIQRYQRGKLPVDRLMGKALALEDINRGFDRMAQWCGPARCGAALTRSGSTTSRVDVAAGQWVVKQCAPHPPETRHR